MMQYKDLYTANREYDPWLPLYIHDGCGNVEKIAAGAALAKYGRRTVSAFSESYVKLMPIDESSQLE